MLQARGPPRSSFSAWLLPSQWDTSLPSVDDQREATNLLILLLKDTWTELPPESPSDSIQNSRSWVTTHKRARGILESG